jgi:hypothetical protein
MMRIPAVVTAATKDHQIEAHSTALAAFGTAIRDQGPCQTAMSPRRCTRPKCHRTKWKKARSLRALLAEKGPQSAQSERRVGPCRVNGECSKTCRICLECKVQRLGKTVVRMSETKMNV